MKQIPIFYTPKMVSESGCISPSASKPLLVMESWKALGLPLEVIEPSAVSVQDLCLAHDRTHVQEILKGSKENGFGNKSKEVAASLAYTSGSMLSASLHALKNKKVAVAPCSGFHHAEWKKSQGFCTFNGLMVTALSLKERGLASRVGILDLDQHYGNGTDNIIERLGIDWITHYTPGRYGFKPSDAPWFLEEIKLLIGQMSDCDIILYQAGGDMHIEDPFGGWMTTEQLYKRDREVFRSARDCKVPIVWNLAGGYQTPIRKVMDIHDNTMRACAEMYLDQETP